MSKQFSREYSFVNRGLIFVTMVNVYLVYFLVSLKMVAKCLPLTDNTQENCDIRITCEDFIKSLKYLPHPYDCQMYYTCEKGTLEILKCDSHKFFNEGEQKCVNAKKSRCIKKCQRFTQNVRCPKSSTSKYMQHPCNCQVYYRCNNGYPVVYECPDEFFFNVKKQKCAKGKHRKCQKNCWMEPQIKHIKYYLQTLNSSDRMDNIKRYLRFSAIKELLAYTFSVSGNSIANDSNTKNNNNNNNTTPRGNDNFVMSYYDTTEMASAANPLKVFAATLLVNNHLDRPSVPSDNAVSFVKVKKPSSSIATTELSSVTRKESAPIEATEEAPVTTEGSSIPIGTTGSSATTEENPVTTDRPSVPTDTIESSAATDDLPSSTEITELFSVTTEQPSTPTETTEDTPVTTDDLSGSTDSTQTSTATVDHSSATETIELSSVTTEESTAPTQTSEESPLTTDGPSVLSDTTEFSATMEEVSSSTDATELSSVTTEDWSTSTETTEAIPVTTDGPSLPANTIEPFATTKDPWRSTETVELSSTITEESSAATETSEKAPITTDEASVPSVTEPPTPSKVTEQISVTTDGPSVPADTTEFTATTEEISTPTETSEETHVTTDRPSIPSDATEPSAAVEDPLSSTVTNELSTIALEGSSIPTEANEETLVTTDGSSIPVDITESSATVKDHSTSTEINELSSATTIDVPYVSTESTETSVTTDEPSDTTEFFVTTEDPPSSMEPSELSSITTEESSTPTETSEETPVTSDLPFIPTDTVEVTTPTNDPSSATETAELSSITTEESSAPTETSEGTPDEPSLLTDITEFPTTTEDPSSSTEAAKLPSVATEWSSETTVITDPSNSTETPEIFSVTTEGAYTTTDTTKRPAESTTESFVSSEISTITERLTTDIPKPECDVANCPSVNGDYPVYLPHPNCTKFCMCDWGNIHVFDCPVGLHFNPILNVCDYPEGAGCSVSTGLPTDTTMQPTGVITNAPSLDLTTDSSSGCDKSKCPAVVLNNPFYFPHDDCEKYCQCIWGDAVSMNCPDGLHFNPSLNVCDWPENAGCDISTPPEVTTSTTTTTAKITTEITTDAPTTIEKSSTDGDKVEGCDNSKCPTSIGYMSYFPHDNCGKYCKCNWGVIVAMDCPTNLHFNPTTNVCDWPEYAGCSRSTDLRTTTAEEPSSTTEVTTIGSSVTEETSTGTNTTKCDRSRCLMGTDYIFYYAHEECGKYCKCDWGNVVIMDCPSGLHFNPSINVCDWPENAGCDRSTSIQKTTASENPITTEEPTTVTNTTTPSITTEATIAITKEPEKLAGCELDKCVPTRGVYPFYIPHKDCTMFCVCEWGSAVSVFDCPPPLHFNPVVNTCDWPQSAGCTGKSYFIKKL